LKFEDKVAIEEIYWRVFGTSSVTNNEIPTWIVCGFIAQIKGIDINWTKAIESTIKKKARRDDAKGGGHLATMKKEHAPHPTNSGGIMDVIDGQLRSQLQSMKIGVEYGGSATVFEDNIEHSFPTTRRCPYGVSSEDIRKVGELLELKKELHSICKSKIKSLNVDHKVSSNKLLGMKFNMDDRKKVVEVEEAKVAKVEKVLAKIFEQRFPAIDVVCDLIFILHHLSHSTPFNYNLQVIWRLAS